MNILLLGGFGLLGSDIYHFFLNRGHTIIRYQKEELNILNVSQLTEKIHFHKPDLIIHAAGFTDVNQSEINFEQAFNINCIGMRNIISAIDDTNIPIIYFSTDYVFSGFKQVPYLETDTPAPVNKYGWSKLMSEDILKANYEKYYIIRTSWLFGENGKCFPKLILKKLMNNQIVRVVNDQVGTPTYTKDLAKCLIDILKLPYGIYHITNSGYTTWYEYAVLIAKYFGFDTKMVLPISSSDLGQSVRRPLYSVLSNNKWMEYHPPLQHYNEALGVFLNNIRYLED
jgi:dTDP-4-dehydrorhamnose reductase